MPQTLIATSLFSVPGYLYFGVSDGRILRVPITTTGDPKDVEEVAHIQGTRRCQKYTGLWDQKSCGRPLGLQFDSSGQNLYVLDAYTGIKKIDLKSRSITSVFDVTNRQVAGRPIVFLDDFTFKETPQGNIYYITDSSAIYEVDAVVLSTMIHETSGRVLQFNEATGKVTVMARDLSFANGITLTDDKKYILVNELNNRRVLKISTDEKDNFKLSVLVDNLPGFPDNIRRSSRPSETYWVALYEVYDIDRPNLAVKLLKYHPYLVPYIVRLSLNLGQLFRYVDPYIGHLIPTREIVYMFETGIIINKIRGENSIGGAVEVNSEGEIVRGVYSYDSKVTHLSEVREVKVGSSKVLFLGSYFNPFMAKVTLE